MLLSLYAIAAYTVIFGGIAVFFALGALMIYRKELKFADVFSPSVIIYIILFTQ